MIVYMLAKDDEIIADDDTRLALRSSASQPMARPVSPSPTSPAIPIAMVIRAISYRTIEKFEKDVREIFDDHAIWELMYFGKTRSSHEPAHMLAATE